MNQSIIELATGEITVEEYTGVTNKEEFIENELYEICSDEHAMCSDICPVYYLNGNAAPDTANDFKVNSGCDCFKNGKEMLKFIREHSS